MPEMRGELSSNCVCGFHPEQIGLLRICEDIFPHFGRVDNGFDRNSLGEPLWYTGVGEGYDKYYSETPTNNVRYPTERHSRGHCAR